MDEIARQIHAKFRVKVVGWDEDSPADARRGIIIYHNGKVVTFVRRCMIKTVDAAAAILSSGDLRRLDAKLVYQAEDDDRQFADFGELVDAYRPHSGEDP